MEVCKTIIVIYNQIVNECLHIKAIDLVLVVIGATGMAIDCDVRSLECICVWTWTYVAPSNWVCLEYRKRWIRNRLLAMRAAYIYL